MLVSQWQTHGDEALAATEGSPTSDPLVFGALVKSRALVTLDPGATGADGFSIPTARIKLEGSFDEGFGCALQTDFMTDALIKDALVSWHPSPWLGGKLGLFKAPFSLELLTSSAALDLYDRASAVKSLAPGRLIGAMIEGEVSDGSIRWHVGAFNGNPLGHMDGESLLGIGRVTYELSLGQSDTLLFGLDAGHGTSTSLDIRDISPSFSVTRTLLGADARLELSPLIFAVEGVVAWLSPSEGDATMPHGGYVKLGYAPLDSLRLLLRGEIFSHDGDAIDRTTITGGLTWHAVDEVRLLLSYVAPLEKSVRDHMVILQLEASL